MKSRIKITGCCFFIPNESVLFRFELIYFYLLFFRFSVVKFLYLFFPEWEKLYCTKRIKPICPCPCHDRSREKVQKYGHHFHPPHPQNRREFPEDLPAEGIPSVWKESLSSSV